MRTRLKVCCISSADEARLAIALGADALGLVSSMPSGPGVLEEPLIAEIAPGVPPPVATFLLTSEVDAQTLVAQARRCLCSVLQLCDSVEPATYQVLREALPALKLVQVVHVLGSDSIAEALAASLHVDALLLDSGNPALRVKELGGTGRTHDWGVSRAIREQAKVPVFLAGGLRPENVAEAVRTVEPFAVDVCSGVRTNGRLDAGKLEAFVAALSRSR
ncbi:MAG TPA: phosphoribosylanthranilate isomerase [Myxococcales bacterium]|jgi:phosphoribosylanthranilate isomerase